MKKWLTGIQQRFVVIVLALLIIIAVFISSFFPQRQQIQMNKYLNDKVFVTAQMIAFNASAGIMFEDIATVKSSMDVLPSLSGVKFVSIVDTTGNEIAGYKTDASLSPEKSRMRALIKNGSAPANKIITNIGDIAFYAEPIQYQGKMVGSVVIGISRTELKNDVWESLFIALGVGIAIVILGGILMFILSGRIVKPIKELRDTAERIAHGDLLIEADIDSEDEIGNLADSFNLMVGHVRKGINDLQLEKESVQRKVDEAVLTIQEQNQQALLKDLKVAGLQHEIKMAADLQMGMLPKKLPDIPGYSIAAMLKMTREAGGDLYDVLPISEKEYLLVIGDVSGKGMPAALYMSAALNAVRTQVACFTKISEETEISPAELLKIVNVLMKGTMQPGNFVTIFLGILNVETHELRYSSGGHDPCVVWNPATRRSELLNTDGQACGAVGAKMYDKFVEEKRMKIEAGDYLIWNTDGITEAKNIAEEEYSDERFWNKTKELTGKETPDEALTHIVHHVESFVGDAEQYDDMTLLCLQRKNYSL